MIRAASLLVASFLVAGGLGSPASAEGDVEAGRTLAAEHCADCHDIAAGGAFKEFPPSFRSIAVFRSREQIYARIVFPPTHSGMPEIAFYNFSSEETENLIDYIVSLEFE